MNSKLLKRIISITLAGATAGIPFAVSAVNADAADTTSGSLSGYYATNAKGFGAEKTITVDGDISDWDSTMLISQGSANDDPRVYRPDSMYEVGSDLYALYAAYDDDNLYLMWEMTNVQDAVCPDEEYPLENGTIYSNGMLNYPFLIAVDTGKSMDAIGNNGKCVTGGTILDSGITYKNSFNRLIVTSSNGQSTSIYGGNSTGISPVEMYTQNNSGITVMCGMGILSKNVYGIKGYGTAGKRAAGDITKDTSAWTDFNTAGHNSSEMDFHYEMSVPLSKLGITKDDITKNGIGASIISTCGKSGMDSLPYDLSMNDNAAKADTLSGSDFSLEKSDDDYVTADFARIGKAKTNPPASLTNRSKLSVTTAEKGMPVVITGAAEGGKAPYRYLFRYKKNSDADFVQLGDTFSKKNTATFYPHIAGSYTAEVQVKDADGNIAVKTLAMKATPSTYDFENTSKLNKSTISVGDYFKMNAVKSGGKAPYTYTFMFKRAGNTKWNIIGTEWGEKTNATLTPTAEADYDMRVLIKDATGRVATKSFKGTVSGKITELTNNSKVSATSVKVGTEVRITGAAVGGTPPYTYAFYFKRSTNTKWVTIGTEFSTKNTATIKPTSAASYDVKVIIKDKAGKTAEKTFKITATA